MLKLWYTMLTKNTSNSISGWFSEIFNLADVSFCGHFCKIVPLPRPQLGALTRFHTLRCGSPHLKLSRSLLIALNYVEYVTFYIMNISLPPSRWMKFWTARNSLKEIYPWTVSNQNIDVVFKSCQYHCMSITHEHLILLSAQSVIAQSVVAIFIIRCKL